MKNDIISIEQNLRKARGQAFADMILNGKPLPDRLFQSEIRAKVELLDKEDLYICQK